MLDITVIYSTIPFVVEIFVVHQYPATLLGTHALTFGTTNGLTYLLKHRIAFVSPCGLLFHCGKYAHASQQGHSACSWEVNVSTAVHSLDRECCFCWFKPLIFGSQINLCLCLFVMLLSFFWLHLFLLDKLICYVYFYWIN